MKVLGWLILSIVFLLGGYAQSVDEGIALLNKGKVAEAKMVFENVLKQNDKVAEAHYRLGLILLSRQYRNEDDAVDHMERAVEINPTSAIYYYGLGAAYGTKAQNASIFKQPFLAPKVKNAFEKAVELDPKLIEAHEGLAQYYWKAPGIMGGDMEKAWKEADLMIGLDEVRGRTFKAGMCLSEKKNTEAVQEIQALTMHRPNEWRAWRAAGLFYWRNKMTDEAIASFEKYVSLRPDTADSYHFLARAYLQKKVADKAIPLAQKVLTLDPQSVNAVDVMAQAFEIKGQKKEAKENYERLLTMDISQEYRKTVEKKVKDLQ